MQKQSGIMLYLRKLGLDGIAWSLRRLYCPVPKEALVLEVGSGGNPYFRSNVLLDAYEATRERHWAPLIVDRPTVIGFVEKLPFADQSFDFIVASHVLEHSSDPEQFLKELQRVGKAGYIEVPDAFMERINPYRDHRLEITQRDRRLLITKKTSWCVDDDLQELYSHRIKPYMTEELMRRRPFEFHVRFYWEGEIDYVLENSEANAGWRPPAACSNEPMHHRFSQVKAMLLQLIRAMFSQRNRNRNIDLQKLLRCPECHERLTEGSNKELACSNCRKIYVAKSGVPDMTKAIDVSEP